MANYGENYFLNSLKIGKIDSNFLPHSTLNPSEVHDEYINYQKGCFVGQEVVSRIKHRQLQKKNILIFEKINPNMLNLPDDFELLIEVKNFLVIRIILFQMEKEFLRLMKAIQPVVSVSIL